MRLDELFNSTSDPHDVEDIIRHIKSHCGEMVSAFKQSNMVLLRGIGDVVGNRPLVVNTTIRSDRRPSATPHANFELMSNAMAALDLPTKKNTISSSTKRNVAGDWGPVYVLFVKDGWTGLTFEGGDFDDLYVQSERVRGDAEAMKNAITKMRPIKITNATELAAALKEKHEEIIFAGTSYVALDSRNPQTAKILQALEIDASNL